MSTESIQRPAHDIVAPPPVKRRWTPEATAFAIAVWKNAPSAADAADAVNGEFGTAFSRLAVIAKMNRLGLSFKGPSICPRFVKNTSEKPARKPKKPKTPKAPKPPKPVAVAKPAPPPRPSLEAPMPESLRVPLREARFAQCRYIAADPRVDPTCCGHRTEPGSSWCPAHAALCTTTARPRVSAGFGSYRRAA